MGGLCCGGKVCCGGQGKAPMASVWELLGSKPLESAGHEFCSDSSELSPPLLSQCARRPDPLRMGIPMALRQEAIAMHVISRHALADLQNATSSHRW